MGIKKVLLYCFVLVANLLLSQDCAVKDYKIPDNQAISLSILVSGAMFDLTNDKVCSIKVRLKHESINQLRMRLKSPSGTTIDLMGPATNASNIIFPTPTYDLTFVPNATTPIPEPGYKPIWDNDQQWIGNRFGGSYHPTNGRLENFNNGPINGTWILELEDVVRFDEGIIECISIFFCNSKVTFEFCDTRAGTIAQSALSICEYDTVRLSNITTFPTGRPNPVFYVPQYVILIGTEIVGYTSDSLKGLPPGMYSVIPFTIANGESSRLPRIGDLVNGSFSNDFARRSICGKVSNSVLSLQVKPVPSTIQAPTQYFCKGSLVTYKGKIFNQVGRYQVRVPSSDNRICDTLYIVNVEIIDLLASIVKSSTFIECSKGELVLTSGNQNLTQSATFKYSGPPILRANRDSAFINQPGSYLLEINDQGCIDTASIRIDLDPSNPKITIISDTITCADTNVIIRVNSTGVISDATWSRGLSTSSNSVSISSPGEISVSVRHNDGCIIQGNVIIAIDTQKIKPQIASPLPTVNCTTKLFNIVIANPSTFSGAFTYKFNNSLISNFFNRDTAGSYTIIGSSLRNGCIDSTTVEIRDIREVPEVTLTTFCDQNNGLFLKANLQRPASRFNWTFPTGFTGVISDLQHTVTVGGLFEFDYVSEEGCRSKPISLNIDLKKEYPEFIAFDDSLGCNRKSTVIRLSKVESNAIYSWAGPFAINSSAAQPTVDALGTYFGTARFANGCFSRDTMQVTLQKDQKSQDLVKNIDVTCKGDTVILSSNNKVDYDYRWRQDLSPPFLKVSNDSLFTRNPGVYRVEIIKKTDPTCVLKREILVDDTRDIPTITSSLTHPNCNPSTVSRIQLTISAPIDKIEWKGPNNFSANTISISDLNAGVYDYLISTKSGCNLRDTFEIIIDSALPKIGLINNGILNCLDLEQGKKVFVMDSASAQTRFIWTKNGDAKVLSDSSRAVIKELGSYTVRAIGANLCENRLSFTMISDTVTRDVFKVTGPAFMCGDSIVKYQISSTKGLTGLEYYDGNTTLPNDNGVVSINRPGVFRYFARDARWCYVFDTFTVKDERDSVKYSAVVKTIGCDSGGVNLTLISPANSIEWSVDNNIVTNKKDLQTNVEGSYNLRLISPKGCVFKASFFIAKDASLPQISNILAPSLLCGDTASNISFDVSRPLSSVEWTLPDKNNILTQNPRFSAKQAGLYKIKAIGQNSCFVLDSIFVALDTLKPSVSLFVDTLTCLRPAQLAIITSPKRLINYNWSGPNNFSSTDSLLRINMVGLYKLSVVAENKCKAETSYQVVENKPEVGLSLQDSLYLPCSSDSLSIIPSASKPLRSLRWIKSDNTSSFSSSINTRSSGLFKLFVISQDGCQGQDSVLVLRDTVTTRATITSNNINCSIDTSLIISQVSTPHMNTRWILPNGNTLQNRPSFSSRDSGRYLLVVERRLTCLDTFSTRVSVDTIPPRISLSRSGIILCESRSVNLNSNATHFRPSALTYQWVTVGGNFTNPQNTTATTVDKRGLYSVFVKDTINACSRSASIFINEDTTTLKSFTFKADAPSCFGGSDGKFTLTNVVGGSGPYTFSIAGLTTPMGNTTISNLRSSRYNLLVRDSFGCRLTQEEFLVDGGRISVNIPLDTTLTLGNFTDINFTTNINKSTIRSIRWRSGQGTLCEGCPSFMFKPTNETYVVLDIISNAGCSASDSMTIYVGKTINWLFPNILSKQSTINNRLTLPLNNAVENVNSVRIFDRWGNIVWQASNFKAGDESFTWVPLDTHPNLSSGVYIIQVDATLIDGSRWNKTRDLTIID